MAQQSLYPVGITIQRFAVRGPLHPFRLHGYKLLMNECWKKYKQLQSVADFFNFILSIFGDVTPMNVYRILNWNPRLPHFARFGESVCDFFFWWVGGDIDAPFLAPWYFVTDRKFRHSADGEKLWSSIEFFF